MTWIVIVEEVFAGNWLGSRLKQPESDAAPRTNAIEGQEQIEEQPNPASGLSIVDWSGDERRERHT